MMQGENHKSESDVSARFGAGPPAEAGAPRQGRRGFLGWKLLVVAGMLAAGLAVATGTAVGQAVTKPSVPTTPTVQVGDDEVLISWGPGGPGQNGLCDTSVYYVNLFEFKSRYFVYGQWWTDKEFILDTNATEATSVLITNDGGGIPADLKPNTKYIAEVHAYGDQCDEYSYSDSTASVEFTTNATSATSDPSTAPSNNGKKAPRKVRELENEATGTQVVLTWKRPRLGNVNKRCDIRDSPTTNSVKYEWEVWNETTGADEPVAENSVSSTASGDTKISVTVPGLVAGTKYAASVSAFSPHCQEYSRWRYTEWTQPT